MFITRRMNFGVLVLCLATRHISFICSLLCWLTFKCAGYPIKTTELSAQMIVHRPTSNRRNFEEERNLEPTAVALAASSQFRMILSQTNFQLQQDAIYTIKLILADFIVAQSYRRAELEIIIDMEVIIQESELVIDIATTRIIFFALASYQSNSTNIAVTSAQPPTSNTVDTQRQVRLNDLVEMSFSSQAQIDKFLQRLQDNVTSPTTANNTDTMLQLQNITNVIVVLASPAQFPPASNVTTTDESATSNSLSPVDKIIISISCGMFIGLVVLFIWHLREIRFFIATQHQVLLRNNTSGSFPHPSQYDHRDVDSTSSENDNDAIGHYTITSVVTSSSSSNGNGMNDKKKFEIIVKEPVTSLPDSKNSSESPQSIPSDFPYRCVDEPDFHDAKDESFIPHHEEGEVKLHECLDTTNNIDEELSLSDFSATPFDVSSVGNISLEQSMASSAMQ